MQAWDSNLNAANVPKIAICIPYNSSWNPEWVDTVYNSIKLIPTDWCNKLTFLCRVPSLPVARDTLINQSLESGCDYTFFLDSDNVFESPQDPNEALKILYQCIDKSNDKNSKIVSGLYRAKQKIGFNYAMWMRVNEKGFLPIDKWTGNWIEADVCGMGCCLIDNRIFKELPKPWFKWENGNDISEDFYFFELAKKHGYKTHVFTDVKLSHLGNLKVKCDGTVTVLDR